MKTTHAWAMCLGPDREPRSYCEKNHSQGKARSNTRHPDQIKTRPRSLSELSTMASSPSHSPFDGVARDLTSPTDEDIYDLHIASYPNRVWFCIAGVILCVTLCRFTSLLCKIRGDTLPLARSCTRGVVQYRRLPTAMLDAFRTIAFRWTVPISNSYTLNLAEIFLTAVYIAVLFVLALVNCKSEPLLLLCNMQHSFPLRKRRIWAATNSIRIIGRTSQVSSLLHNFR